METAVPALVPVFRTIVRRKDPIMLTLLLLAGLAWGGCRLAGAVLHTLRALPRCNQDMVFF